jgi:predicted RNase H-like HicB family nuclease
VSQSSPRQCNSSPVALSVLSNQPASDAKGENAVRNEFTAIIEKDDDWFIAYCPEVPGANGQGRTKDEAKTSLAEAIELILEDRRGFTA